MFRRLLPLLRPSSSAAFPRTTRPLSIMTSSSSPLLRPCKLALIQLATGSSKPTNLTRAAEFVATAAKSGADIVVLPECFNSPYGCEHFPTYAEPIPAIGATEGVAEAENMPSFSALAQMAKENSVHLVGGSIPELVVADDGRKPRYYNTSMVFSPKGVLLATHRKIHLFDIDIPGKITFRESDVLSAGDTPTLVDIPGIGKLALAICYDVRFPELAMMAARKGAFAVVYPGAFNMTTGPMHWELLARARAMDNQVYVGMCSPARVQEGGYVAFGESMVVDPSGVVVEKLGADEGMCVVELVPERIVEVRKAIPVGTQRRWDVYADVSRVPPMEGGKGRD